MGIWDFLTADYATRQQRTRDLNDRLGGLLSYYLGPTGIPDRLSSANALLNPIDQIGEAGANTVVAFDPTRSKQERMQAALNAGLGTATALAPAIAGKLASQPARQTLMETIAGTSGQADAAPSVQSSEPRGILAYHGSPHDFDRFSMDKIGTGEGAQAYGHGLYFAENEGVARGYRDALSRPYYVTDDGANVADKYGADVVDAFESVGGDPTEVTATIDRLRSAVQRNLADFGVQDVSELQPEYAGDLASSTIDMARRAEGLRALLKSEDVRRVNEGRLYEVNIDANPEDFLDWDKPFASADDVERFAARFDAVDPALRKRIEDFGYMRQQMGQPMPDGNDIIREVMGGIGSKDAARASETMREAGIAGIRYLDAGSRGAGDGSRNYVVFDENLINIVRKYGIAGAAAMLGVSTMDVEQAMAQGAQPQQSGLLSPMEQ